ncbi:MAG: hypothetical protein RJA99_4233 [Pseudomonadota bacterium]|jgi:hypothetical protein
MIEVLCWTPTRDMFVAGMTGTRLPLPGVAPEYWPTLCTLSDDGAALVPIAGIVIDEIGALVRVPAVLADDGAVITPAVMVGGHHVNLLAYGEIAAMLTAGLPQTDEDGMPLGLFERSRLLTLIPGLAWTAADDVPGGYVGPNGVRLFDPAAVRRRRRVWFGVGG